MKQGKKNYISPYILPGLVGISLFYIVSFGESIYYAFTDGIADRRFVGLENFADLLVNPAFRLAAWNNIRFMVPAVLMLMVMALVIAWLLSDGSCGTVLYMLLIPMVIPSSAFLPGIKEIFREGGMLTALGAGQKDFLREWAFGILLFVYLIKNMGYLVVILYGAIRELPVELWEIYRLEKRTGVDYLWLVVIPLIKPSLFFCLIIAVMGTLKIYRETWLLFGQSPPLNVYMLQYFMNNNFQKLNYQRLSGAAILIVLLLSIFVGLALYGGWHEKK